MAINSVYRAIPLPDRIDFDEDETRKRALSYFEFMCKRHSVRDFSDRDVPEDVIRTCIQAAGRAPSGANQQPWHFVAVRSTSAKREIRLAAEEEERAFYAGGGGDEWITALEPIGTNSSKPHLEKAPWLIVVFAQRYGTKPDGSRHKHYYVNESVGIAAGFLLSALHHVGLVTLTHTPNPMKFLNTLLKRPTNEKPIMILPVGYPALDATVPEFAKHKKPVDEVMTVV